MVLALPLQCCVTCIEVLHKPARRGWDSGRRISLPAFKLSSQDRFRPSRLPFRNKWRLPHQGNYFLITDPYTQNICTTCPELLQRLKKFSNYYKQYCRHSKFPSSLDTWQWNRLPKIYVGSSSTFLHTKQLYTSLGTPPKMDEWKNAFNHKNWPRQSGTPKWDVRALRGYL